MTAPGTLLMARCSYRKRSGRSPPGAWKCPPWKRETNLLGAIARGTTDGLHLALNVGAMLITFIALLALLNAIMGGISQLASHGLVPGKFADRFRLDVRRPLPG